MSGRLRRINIMFLILVLSSCLVGQVRAEPGANRPFRYIIFINNVNQAWGLRHEGIRRVEVLLDQRAFGEGTLRQLYAFIAKRFASPYAMDIWVYTNMEQVLTPEEQDRPKPSEIEWNPYYKKYPWAIFIRRADYELIRYSPGAPSFKRMTLVLSGHDPLASMKPKSAVRR